MFKYHIKNRKVDKELQSQAINAMKTGSDAKQVAQWLEKETGRKVLPKDVHNMVQKTKTHTKNNRKQKDASRLKTLENLINNRIEVDKCNNFVQALDVETSTKIYMYYYQNNTMKELYQNFGEILFVDGTYSLNRNNYPCYIMTVRDCNGNSQIVAIAVLAYEREGCLNVFFNTFANNNDVSTTKAIMIDKDLTEWKCLKNNFPQSNIYFCKFHCEKIFKREIKNKKLLPLLTELLECKTSRKFDEAYEQLKTELKLDNRDEKYLNDNWLNCMDNWVKYKRINGYTLGNDTNNAVETINSILKNFVDKNAPMHDCLQGIFDLIDYLKTKFDYKTFLQRSKVRIDTTNKEDEIISIINKECTPYAAELVINQYKASKTCNYKAIYRTTEASLTSGNATYLINNYLSLTEDSVPNCTCWDFLSYNLPCRHVFYVRNAANLDTSDIFKSFMVIERWKNRNASSSIRPVSIQSNTQSTIHITNINR
jgi:hypothetical protein